MFRDDQIRLLHLSESGYLVVVTRRLGVDLPLLVFDPVGSEVCVTGATALPKMDEFFIQCSEETNDLVETITDPRRDARIMFW